MSVSDLVVLVADKDMEQTVRGLLARSPSLGIRAIPDARIFVHMGRDSGCRTQCQDFLRSLQKQYRFAIVIFDLEGSGGETSARSDLEQSIERKLYANGWNQRAAVIALEPELEVWVWSDSPEVDEILGWAGRDPGLREWIRDRFELTELRKPQRPKEAMRAALREARKQPSAALF